MPLHAVAYVSDAMAGIGSADLDRLLQAALGFNRVAGVTAVLVFDGARFLQYFEGPEDGVDSVYQRVLNARLHGNLRELAHCSVAARRFPRWTMASTAVEPALLDAMLVGRWDDCATLACADAAGDGACTGFAALRAVWTGEHGELEPAAVTLGS